MHLIVRFCIVTCSNTLFCCCECVLVLFCFTVLSCKYVFPFFLCFLTFVDMFNIEKQFFQRLDQWNECVCMYVYTLMYVSMFVCIHNICMYACMKLGIYIYMYYICMYKLYIIMRICVYECVYMCVIYVYD